MMKMPNFKIHMYVSNYSDRLKTILLDDLREEFSDCLGSDAKVKLLSSEQYWKFPELTGCIFGFYGESLDLKNLSEMFELDWFFTGDESAIWSKHLKKDTFLNDNIEWVHIYLCD